MGKRINNLIGEQFGRLKVLKDSNKRTKSGDVVWSCKCDCGNHSDISSCNLKSGNTKSCGCLNLEKLIKRKTKHGHRINKKPSITYVSWQSIIQRCHNNKYPEFKYYGGRGIYVCRRWRNSFENFLADMGERPSIKFHLHRIDNNKGYEIDNCEWKEKFHHLSEHKRGKNNERF